MLEVSFSVPKFIFVIILTTGCFAFLTYRKTIKTKLFFSLIGLFLLIYSGIGGCIVESNAFFLSYYSIYLIILTLTIRFSPFSIHFTSDDHKKFDSYINRHGSKIVAFYLFIKVCKLIFPEFLLYRIIFPPSPDLTSFFADLLSGDKIHPVTQLLNLITTFFIPFFYWSLYKYRKNLLLILFFIFLDLYLGYCELAYIGRYNILFALIIIFSFILQTSSRKTRTRLIIGALFGIPIISYMFYMYSFLRQGDSGGNIGVFDATVYLLSQEINYPLHFDYYKDHFNILLIDDYIEWFLFLPLPGFLKFGYGDMNLTYDFSTWVTGLAPGDTAFNVLLPGLIGESLYVCSPSFYVFHAILLGIIIKFVYKTLYNQPTLIFVFFYYAGLFSFVLNRGGTTSVYPSVMKNFLLLTLLLLYLRNHSRKRQKI